MADYRAVINKGLKRAWLELNTLKTTITFNRKSTPGFNFSTSDANVSDDGSVEIEVVLFDSKKVDGVEVREILFRHMDVGSISQYSTVSINNEEWRIAEGISNDDYYTKTIDVVRGGR